MTNREVKVTTVKRTKKNLDSLSHKITLLDVNSWMQWSHRQLMIKIQANTPHFPFWIPTICFGQTMLVTDRWCNDCCFMILKYCTTCTFGWVRKTIGFGTNTTGSQFTIGSERKMQMQIVQNLHKKLIKQKKLYL